MAVRVLDVTTAGVDAHGGSDVFNFPVGDEPVNILSIPEFGGPHRPEKGHTLQLDVFTTGGLDSVSCNFKESVLGDRTSQSVQFTGKFINHII